LYGHVFRKEKEKEKGRFLETTSSPTCSSAMDNGPRGVINVAQPGKQLPLPPARKK